MNPNTSKFFHIKALIAGSLYEIFGMIAGARLSAEKESSSASSEGGDKRQAQRLLKPAEKVGGSREKRRV